MYTKNYRAVAIILSLLLFFSLIFYHDSVEVRAADPLTITAIIAAATLGFATGAGTEVGQQMIHSVMQKLGWTSADIQVDENGNVILSESQMNELKAALEAEVDSINAQNGIWIYEPINGNKPMSYESYVASLGDSSGSFWRDLPGKLGEFYNSQYWWLNTGYGANVCGVPPGAVWVCGTEGGAVTFYHAGTGDMIATQTYNSFGNLVPQNSSYGQSCYLGQPHEVFMSFSDFERWSEKEDKPYELIAPTWTGGDLVIPADDLKDTDGDGIPDGVDEDDDGDGVPDEEDDYTNPPNSEVGWLEKIYNKLDEILDQVKQIKWIGVVDTVIDAIDAFGDEVGSGIAGVVDAVTGFLSEVFPLCFIWDIFLVLDMFEAEPVEPVFTISLDFTALGLSEEPYELVIDLTEYDSLFSMLRVFELLFFMGGLWNLTYSWIVGKGDTV